MLDLTLNMNLKIGNVIMISKTSTVLDNSELYRFVLEYVGENLVNEFMEEFYTKGIVSLGLYDTVYWDNNRSRCIHEAVSHLS